MLTSALAVQNATNSCIKLYVNQKVFWSQSDQAKC